MKVITTQEMRDLEIRCEKEYAISPLQLMENAGRGIAEWVTKFVSDKNLTKKILIVCGGGNNGGDGFVAARYLQNQGAEARVVCLTDLGALKGPAKINFNKIKKIKKIKKIVVHKACNKEQFEKIKSAFDVPVILDCILGTGLKNEVRGYLREVIDYINTLTSVVISVDIPSGMDGNTGAGNAIRAFATLTLGLPKTGLLKPANVDTVGFLNVVDIGIPKELVRDANSSINYMCADDFAGLIPKRKPSGHKGKFGHVLVIAGSPRYTGAAELCVRGALRSGAGLVTLGATNGLRPVYQTKFTEAMTLGLPETEDGALSYEAHPYILKFIENVDSVAIGPGLGRHPDTLKLIKKIISESRKPVVADADAIHAIAEEPLVLRKAHAPIIITPHPGEMADLLHMQVKNVLNEKLTITRELAGKYGITVVLKGFHTAVAESDKKIYINSSGNPGMSSGGMGDVLTGIIASFLAQGINTLNSSRLGVFIHGAAGDLVSSEKGEIGVLASDLIEKLPCVLNRICGIR